MHATIAELEAELEVLRAEYAASPKSAVLAEKVGEKTNHYVELRREAKRAAMPKPEPLPPAQRFLDNGEWADLLAAEHEVCPLCEGGGRNNFIWPACPTKGYSARVGNLGVQCSLCRGQYQLGESEDG